MKGERVAQLELLLRAHPEGLRRSDIARRLSVHRSTISRYVEELSSITDIYEDGGLLKIVIKDDEKESMALSVYESIALNLGAESLSTSATNPHLASGLRKIAMNMRSYAPKVSDNILQVAEKIDKEASSVSNKKYNNVFNTLIDAWVSGRIIKLVDNLHNEYQIAPYFIGFKEEENSSRQPITLTGRLRHTKEIITIDIHTIQEAIILDETFTIPDNLKPFKKNKNKGQSHDLVDIITFTLEISDKSILNAFSGLHVENVNYIAEDNGKIITSFDAENSIELMMRFFQCGSSVTILAPESYKKKYINYLSKILNQYN